MTTLTDMAVTQQVDERHWRVVLGRLHTTVRTGSFVRGAELVQRLAAVAEELGHHPDVVLRYPSVAVSTWSHDVGALTDRDVRLAHAISAVVDELGLDADTRAPQATEIAVDALDIAAVAPFWRAVMGYENERLEAEDPSPALVDPRGVGPSVWFQQMEAPRPQRNRIHLDVTVPHDEAEARVAATLAAGGRLVSDDRAPAWWVLADPEGNEVCVCTWQARG
ncbi:MULTISPECIES: VOC family protein [unclassified Actinotalea]|uniref:VOC family protein n=1 Tax=unclassified Actinotalea TaxID=2638618 RepID=UPI0015F5E672|nr:MULTISPECIES: VOC family protein [unclassified Actinotalea]